MLEVYFKLISIKKDSDKVKYPYSLDKSYTFTQNQIDVYYNDNNILVPAREHNKKK